MCECMQVHVCVCVCALCQGSPSWGPLCVQEKLLTPSGVFQTLQDVLLALVGHTLDSGPTLLSSHVHPLPHYCRREGWRPRENKVPCLLRPHSQLRCHKLFSFLTRL